MSVFESSVEVLALWILRILNIENINGFVRVTYPLYTYSLQYAHFDFKKKLLYAEFALVGLFYLFNYI